MAWKGTLVTFVVCIYGISSQIECPAECNCAHVQGRLTTDCSGKGLYTVPHDIPAKTMTLKLDGNNFVHVDNNFRSRNVLKDVTSLHLSHCKISELGDKVFDSMGNLEFLDLSANRLHSLPKEIFNKLHRLRRLSLSSNHLKTLEPRSFEGAVKLEKLDLSKNQIDFIFANAFENLPSLKEINLEGNKLFRVDVSVFERLPHLSLLNLQHNIWRCDCHLRDFVNYLEKRYLALPAMCVSPPKYKGKKWNQLISNEFACAPEFIDKSNQVKHRVAAGSNVSFHCTFRADPKPNIIWQFRPQNQSEKRNLESKTAKIGMYSKELDSTTWIYHLTVWKVTAHDQGHYMCLATNAADTAVELFEVELIKKGHPSSSAGNSGDSHGKSGTKPQSSVVWSSDMLLVAIVLCAALAIVLVVVGVLYCYRRQITVGTGQVAYSSVNGYGYHVIDGNMGGFGNKQQVAANNYYMPSPCTYYEPEFVPVCLEKKILGSNISVPQDDSGYLESAGSQPSPRLHCQYSNSPNQRRSLNGPSEYDSNKDCNSDQNKRYSFHNGKAPLAVEENAESRMPLRETAL